MNGFRGDDDLKLANERILAMHVDAARQRLVRRAEAPAPTPAHGTVAAAIAWSRRVLHGAAASVVG